MKIKAGINKFIYVISVLVVLAAYPVLGLAAEGDCGYEGGISSGEAINKLYDYQEILLVTGKPVVVKGTLSVKKNLKDTTETWTYVYTNLRNEEEGITLNRTISYEVTITTKSNGQIQKQVSLRGIPYENIRVGNTTYILRRYNFSKSTIVDVKSIAQYFAGEFVGQKTYTVTGGTGTSTGTVTVSTTGKVFGYNQHWSNAESQIIDYVVSGTREGASWTGTMKTGVSLTTSKKLYYEENKPNEISFEGGYVQRQNNLSVLQYEGEFPELDTRGMPTDFLIRPKGTLKFDTSPIVTRLVVPTLEHLKGHWSEDDARILYSLEVFKGSSEDFRPNDYMTRAELAKAIILAGRLLSDEEAAAAELSPEERRRAGAGGRNNEEVQIFEDVPLDHPYYVYIKEVHERKIMQGVSLKQFWPESTVTRAQAVTLLVRALGFENRAPSPTAVTPFRDNDDIPSWSRNAVYVAEKIGLVKGDTYGNMNPSKPMTKGEVAALLNRTINYMRQDIAKDYRENIILY